MTSPNNLRKGDYLCVATNVLATVESENNVEIDILQKPAITTFGPGTSDSPHYTKTGEEVEVACTATGIPLPT